MSLTLPGVEPIPIHLCDCCLGLRGDGLGVPGGWVDGSTHAAHAVPVTSHHPKTATSNGNPAASIDACTALPDRSHTALARFWIGDTDDLHKSNPRIRIDRCRSTPPQQARSGATHTAAAAGRRRIANTTPAHTSTLPSITRPSESIDRPIEQPPPQLAAQP